MIQGISKISNAYPIYVHAHGIVTSPIPVLKSVRVITNSFSANLNAANQSIQYNEIRLVIGSVNKEKLSIYVFGKNGLILQAASVSQYYNITTNNLIRFGSTFNGMIFDASIMQGDGISLEEAYKIYNSEKNIYGL